MLFRSGDSASRRSIDHYSRLICGEERSSRARARGSGRSERSRDGCRIPRKPGNTGKAGGGRAGGHLLADWARPEAERAEVSSAVHQEDMVKTLCVSRLGVRAQGKVTLTEGAAFFSTFGLGEKART